MKWIYNLLGSLLSFFDRITGSYALALLFYALIFKIVFLPFSIKQQKNQIAMAKLTPKIELIKAKYRGRTDQRTMQKQQQEIMDLQQKEGYSPMAGCLPLLLQLPLIMLLYAVIQNPLSYIAKTSSVINDYNDGIASDSYTVEDIPESIRDYYGDIVVKYDENGTAVLTRKEITKADVVAVVWKDLNDSDYDSSKRLEISLINAIYNTVESNGGYVDTLHAMGLDYDTIPNFKFLGVNLADQPSMQKLNVLTLIPFLAAVASWFSMWLTRKINNTGLNATPDGQTKSSMLIMDLMMPLMTLFIAFSFSGMLGIYWVLQSILGLVQSLILSFVMPIPKYTPEEVKAINKAKKDAEKEAKRLLKENPKHKSLHYIDEDDYEELPDVKTREDDDDEGPGFSGAGMPEIKD